MCGIFGILGPKGADHENLRRMASALAHRGPDDEGFYLNGSVAMGSRRLSVIDLEGGRQPLSNEDGSIWVVQNGEIYNYEQLRKSLEQEGHVFKTKSDTEVIVHLYEDFGEGCVDRLQGMFAFAIWDERSQKLMLARDRLGQKPIYFAQSGSSFVFASEVKAILAVEGFGREVDFQSISHYLSLRFIPSPQTMFKNVRKLPPAHFLILQDSSVKTHRYWDLSFRGKSKLNERDLTDALEERLGQAVSSHLVSDVPVGAYLSGGLDTSMIVAMMAQLLPGAFKTFAIGVQEADYNELPFARLVASHYGTRHVEQEARWNIANLLPEMIWHLDEPSDPIAAPMYLAATLASQHVKVVMGGDGGDELFAGFDRYWGVGKADYYARLPLLLRKRVLSPIIGTLPQNFGYKSLSQRLSWLDQVSRLPEGGQRYAEATLFFRFNGMDKEQLFGDELWRDLRHVDSASVIVDQYRAANAEDPLDRMLYADYVTRLPEHSLLLTDRMTMAHGLEARSPFLDHNLVEFLATFPPELKIRNGQLKYVLRRLASRYLPEEIVRRKKHGFMFPIAYWFRRELYPVLKHLLLESYFVREDLFKRESVIQLVEDHRRGSVDNHVRLWMLLNLEVWHQIFIDQQDPAEVTHRLRAVTSTARNGIT